MVSFLMFKSLSHFEAWCEGVFSFFLAVLSGLWDFSSPTRDPTWVLGIESVEGPLDHQGIPL